MPVLEYPDSPFGAEYYDELDKRIVIVIPVGGGRTKPKVGSDFKLPAGDTKSPASSDQRISVYLGINTGNYTTDAGGDVILPPIPIEWVVAPHSNNVTGGHHCPSRADNLRLFGLTNLVVMALLVVVGYRPLVHKVTGGLLGRHSSKRASAFWTWIFSVALQVGANAVISRLIVSTPGYQDLSMLNIFALYSSRPRVNLIFLAWLRILVGPIKSAMDADRSESTFVWWVGRLKHGLQERKNKKKGAETEANTTAEKNPKPGTAEYWRRRGIEPTPNSNVSHNDDDLSPAVVVPHRSARVEEYWALRPYMWPYTDAYVATAIGEVFLQLVSAIFVGITWRRFPNEVIRDHMMTRVNCLLAAPAIALVGWLVLPIWWREHHHGHLEDFYSSDPCLKAETVILYSALVGFFVYGASWYYWTEFLNLPGSLWCPPDLIEQGAVWAGFSTLSSAFGVLF